MPVRSLRAAAVALAVATMVSGCGETSLRDVSVEGDGTLPAPLARAWSQQVADDTGARVTIRTAGSVESLRELRAGPSSFALVTEPTEADAAAAAADDGALMHIPLVLSPVAVAYELKKWRQRDVRIASGMRFDAATLAGTFRARIWSWITEQILARNGGLDIPDELILVCHRSDPAATTAAFTGYLSRRSSWWRQGLGSGERVAWDEVRSIELPTIFAVRGTTGMLRCLRREGGLIGYLDAADAKRAGIPVARVANDTGRFVAPTIAGAQAAASSVELPADLRFSLLDAPGRDSYPITSVHFAAAPRDLCAAGVEPDEAAAVKAWLGHALGEEGQRAARRLGYAPLPERMRTKAEAAVDRLECDGAAIG